MIEVATPFFHRSYWTRIYANVLLSGHSGINPEHLNYFKIHRQSVRPSNLTQTFPRRFFHQPLCKMILGKRVSLADMEVVDADFHRMLTWTL